MWLIKFSKKQTCKKINQYKVKLKKMEYYYTELVWETIMEYLIILPKVKMIRYFIDIFMDFEKLKLNTLLMKCNNKYIPQFKYTSEKFTFLVCKKRRECFLLLNTKEYMTSELVNKINDILQIKIDGKNVTYHTGIFTVGVGHGKESTWLSERPLEFRKGNKLVTQFKNVTKITGKVNKSQLCKLGLFSLCLRE
jgi:hypothetical protein